jgi:hypothetical protein
MRGVKTKTAGRWKRVVISLTLFFVLAIFLNAVNNVYQKKKSAEALLVRMENEVQELKERESFLSSSLSRLQTVEGIKFEIRRKLNVAEAGESVAIIVAQEETDRANPSDLSVWQQIKLFFTKLFE